MSFSKDFLWGVAAASYQVEGGHTDGRVPSVWDMHAAWPGKVFEEHNGSVACDQYNRYEEDAQLMADLGAKAYRFSIAWPRVMSDDGQLNKPGLDYYDRLADALLAKGVTPWATLFHWDMPMWAFRKGGWLNRASADWFAEYVEHIADALGDRVKNWFTLNEPQVFLGLGHQTGEHAPGIKLPDSELVIAAHHTLMAHGRAVKVLREKVDDARVGFAPTSPVAAAASDSPEDIEAARRFMFTCEPKRWIWSDTWYSGPAIQGAYPDDGLAFLGKHLPAGFEDDIARVIHEPLDFFGVNVYQGPTIKATDDGPKPVPFPVGGPITMFHWAVTPEVLYWGPKLFNERYGLPVYVTENGCASMDWVHVDGEVHDAPRVDFITRYLRALKRAAADDVDIAGYFHWSVLDNYEWAEGYRMRFGIVYVDFETQQRIPKDSYKWYAKIIESNGGALDG
ncbi:MAG: GH1 family beta-glucosidase [Planctomycetota bacterium]